MALGQEGAGKKEYDQLLNVASAANKTPTLEHLIMHTLTSSERIGKPDYHCAHWDYKDRAAEEIKKSLPELAKKTTFFWIGWFVSNLWTLLRPLELVSISTMSLFTSH